MFKIDSFDEIYKWRNLILLLSLERTKLVLYEIRFPFRNVDSIRDVSRKFLRQFIEVENKLIFMGGISEDARALFENLYQELLERIGTSLTDALCRWGNHIDLFNDFERYLWNVENDVIEPLINSFESGKLTLPDSLRPKKPQISVLVAKWHSRIRTTLEIMDMMENLEEDAWDRFVFSYYKKGYIDTQENELSDSSVNTPVTTLESIVNKFDLNQLLCEFKLIFEPEELNYFVNWIDSLTGEKRGDKDLFANCDSDL